MRDYAPGPNKSKMGKPAAPASLPASPVLNLQQHIGNQAVQRLLNRAAPIQRQPAPGTVQATDVTTLIQQIDTAWAAGQNPQDVFTVLKSDVANKNAADPALVKKLQSILKADDLWLAQKIMDRKLGMTDGIVEGKKTASPTPKPVEVTYFQGTSSENALIIAGVHGSERQGMQVVKLVIEELKKATKKPYYNVIIVPSLFPDNSSFENKTAKNKDQHELGKRETTTPTNRNFPEDGKRLGDATKDKSGQPLDAMSRPIQPENIMLMELMEKFKPTRIASVHGTWDPAKAGVFIDKPFLSKTRLADIKKTASIIASVQIAAIPQLGLYGHAAIAAMIEKLLIDQAKADDAKKLKTDEVLATQMALQIAHETDKKIGTSLEKRPRVPAAQKDSAAVAGNRVDETKKELTLLWGGGTEGGESLGSYAPGQGVSVFTIEPAINRNSDDYGSDYKQFSNEDARKDVLTEAERKTELMSYAEAVMNIFLADPKQVKDPGFKAKYQ